MAPVQTVQFGKQTSSSGTCVAVLTLDHAPVNAIAAGVRAALADVIKKALQDDEVKAIVVTGAGKQFCAGADISEFQSSLEFMKFPSVLAVVEGSSKPVVGCIDGVALGGGCEVALSCHYRIASPRAMIGLPEVSLGLLPCFAGTQRMPRLVGVERAIDLMCSGNPLNAKAAKDCGLFDDVIEGDKAAVLKSAIDFAASKVGSDMAQRRLSNASATSPGKEFFDKKRKQYAASRAGEVAPQAIITCIEAATDRPFDAGMKLEAEEFRVLMSGYQSKALINMFFAERDCSKVPGLTAKPGPLNSVGIIGAGLMGGGIAMCCAEAGMKVTLLDIDAKNLERGMNVIKKNYKRSVDRKSKTQAAVDKFLSLISPSSTYESLSDCDIVVEAVFENMDLKKKIFSSLDKVCKQGAVLASNTSRLNIDEIASATQRPQDVIGCHFFSPANVMRLLENVRGSKSSPRTIATAMAFGVKIKKITCLVGNCDGFIANRVMGVSGSRDLVHSGLLPHQIDAAAEAYGMKMGPFRMNDLVGLDLFGRERASTGKATPDKDAFDAMYKAERFGQKNGKGFYKYDDKGKLSRDPEGEAIVQKVWSNLGVSPSSMTQEEIVEKLYLPVVNEGFKCLEEGMAIRPADIDVCLHFGYNWPRYRGGPMRWAAAMGLPVALEKIQKQGMTASTLLKECVDKSWTLDSPELTKRIEQAWNGRWSKL